MEEIHIKIGENNLFVKGRYFKKEDDVNIPEYFEIDSIECGEKDITDLLEFANSKPYGTILNIIEELVLENKE